MGSKDCKEGRLAAMHNVASYKYGLLIARNMFNLSYKQQDS